MTDLAQGLAVRPAITMPSPSSIRPRQQETPAESGRATARAVLEAALSGVELTAVDRRFLSRLSQWDKRNATTVASLISRARQRGRREAALTAAQREIVLAALMDACAYRTSGTASADCWDCASSTSGLCAGHLQDADRARAFADLAAALCGEVSAEALPRLPAVSDVPEFRHRTAVPSLRLVPERLVP